VPEEEESHVEKYDKMMNVYQKSVLTLQNEDYLSLRIQDLERLLEFYGMDFSSCVVHPDYVEKLAELRKRMDVEESIERKSEEGEVDDDKEDNDDDSGDKQEDSTKKKGKNGSKSLLEEESESDPKGEEEEEEREEKVKKKKEIDRLREDVARRFGEDEEEKTNGSMVDSSNSKEDNPLPLSSEGKEEEEEEEEEKEDNTEEGKALKDESFSHFAYSNINFEIKKDAKTIGQRSREEMMRQFQGKETPSISAFKRIMRSLQDPLSRFCFLLDQSIFLSFDKILIFFHSLSMEVFSQLPHLPALALIRNTLDSFFLVRHLFVTSTIPADPLFSLLELFRGQIEAEMECERRVIGKSSFKRNSSSVFANLPSKYIPQPLEVAPDPPHRNEQGKTNGNGLRVVVRGLYVAVVDALSSGVFLGRWDVCPARSTENQLETLIFVSDLLDCLYLATDEEWMNGMQGLIDYRPASREGRLAKDEFEGLLVKWGTSLDGLALMLDEAIYLLHFIRFQILLNQVLI